MQMYNPVDAGYEYTPIEAFSAPVSPSKGAQHAGTPPSPRDSALRTPLPQQKTNPSDLRDRPIKNGWLGASPATHPATHTPPPGTETLVHSFDSAVSAPSSPEQRAPMGAWSSCRALGASGTPPRSPPLAPYSPNTTDVWMLVEGGGPCRFLEFQTVGAAGVGHCETEVDSIGSRQRSKDDEIACLDLTVEEWQNTAQLSNKRSPDKIETMDVKVASGGNCSDEARQEHEGAATAEAVVGATGRNYLAGGLVVILETAQPKQAQGPGEGLKQLVETPGGSVRDSERVTERQDPVPSQ